MKISRIFRSIVTTLLLILSASLESGLQAQSIRWLAVGDLHSAYSEAGAISEGKADMLIWPGVQFWGGNKYAEGLWIAVENFVDEDGRPWSVKISHVGPRGTLSQEAFNLPSVGTSRFEPPVVTVDGMETFDKPFTNDVTDPNLKADRMLVTKTNYINGITLERRILQFSQEFHDDYHIIEYQFRNSGNLDADPETELNQVLSTVYFYFQSRNSPNKMAALSNSGFQWFGKYTMNDATLGISDYGVDFRSQYSWFGSGPNDYGSWNTIGGPLLVDSNPYGFAMVPGDTVGRLAAAHHVGRVIIHADEVAHPPDIQVPDNPAQPSTMNYFDSDLPILGENDHTNEDKMALELDLIKAGRGTPQARVVAPDLDFARQTVNPALGAAGGNSFGEGFGPYTMQPGDIVNIVVAEAVGGLDANLAREIGKAYKRSGFDDDLKITQTINGREIAMTKNEWVMTTRDSLFKTFRKAIANYESGYNIPHPPLPPRDLKVTSGIGKNTLEWDIYDGANHEGFEVYQAPNRVDSLTYRLLAELGPEARRYEDTDVIRGIGYYYYVQSVGTVNNDPTGLTPTGVRLKSSRYYAQTYTPAIPRRTPADDLEDIRVVPNPFSLSQSPDVRWPDQQDKIGFLNIPGRCTIRIFTQLGELVRSITHTDGTGDEYWNLTTMSNQVVVSGIYIAVIKDLDSGQSRTVKLVIIR